MDFFPSSLAGLVFTACIAFFIFIVLFLIFRAFVLWYWKIDRIVELLEDISIKLKKPREPDPVKVSPPDDTP